MTIESLLLNAADRGDREAIAELRRRYGKLTCKLPKRLSVKELAELKSLCAALEEEFRNDAVRGRPHGLVL